MEYPILNFEYIDRTIPERYHFSFTFKDERKIFFYTYDDLSGFKPPYDMSQPHDFIEFGMLLLMYEEEIKRGIEKYRAKFKGKYQ